MKKIILLLLITTSLFSQQRDLPPIDLSRDMIGEPLTPNKSFDINASRPCIIVKWNVILDINVQSAQNRIDNVLTAVDEVVEFYKLQDYQIIPTINYLTYDIDTAVFNSYGGSLFTVYNNFFPFKNNWGSNFDATSLVFSHGVSDYAGLASTTSMCNQFNNLSIILYWGTPWVQRQLLAHELGHNLGLPHIDQEILDLMNPSARNETQFTFSQGSLDNLEYFRQQYKDCLDTCSLLPLFTDDIRSFNVDNVCEDMIIKDIVLDDPYESIYTTDYKIIDNTLYLTVTTNSGKTFTKSKKVDFNDCFIVYPNPNNGLFEIRSSKPIDKIDIVNISSYRIVDINNLVPGYYIAMIRSKGHLVIKNIVIK